MERNSVTTRETEATAPLVSVIIPCHNYGHFIEETLASVFEQSYKNIEIIVIDDDSTDNVKQVLSKYPQVRYHFIKHQGKKTPAYASNCGLEICKGDFIIFLGADDKLSPDYVWKCVNRYQSYAGKAGFVFTGFRAFGDRDYVSIPPMKKLTRWNYDNHRGAIGAALVPRNVYMKLGGYDVNLSGYEDADWVIRACEEGYVGLAVQEPLHYYRFHGASVNSNAKTGTAFKELKRKHRLYGLVFSFNAFFRLLNYRISNPRQSSVKLYSKLISKFSKKEKTK